VRESTAIPCTQIAPIVVSKVSPFSDFPGLARVLRLRAHSLCRPLGEATLIRAGADYNRSIARWSKEESSSRSENAPTGMVVC
jgi:hypothetical protein